MEQYNPECRQKFYAFVANEVYLHCHPSEYIYRLFSKTDQFNIQHVEMAYYRLFSQWLQLIKQHIVDLNFSGNYVDIMEKWFYSKNDITLMYIVEFIHRIHYFNHYIRDKPEELSNYRSMVHIAVSVNTTDNYNLDVPMRFLQCIYESK